MTALSKPISLTPEEDGILRKLYVQFGIPRDQYKRRPEDLIALTRRWNKLTGRHDEPGELIRYIKNQQKATKRLAEPWPTFKGSHKKAPALSTQLDEKQLDALREIYEEIVLPLGIGMDLLEANQEVVDQIAKRFAKRTGKIVPGLTLISIAEEKRKRGLWCTVEKRKGAWSDLDQVDRLKEASGDDGDKKERPKKPK
jgi:hypothetical protein